MSYALSLVQSSFTVAQRLLCLLALGDVSGVNGNRRHFSLCVKDRVKAVIKDSSVTLVFKAHRLPRTNHLFNPRSAGGGQVRGDKVIDADAEEFVYALAVSLSPDCVDSKDGSVTIQ